MDVEADTMTPSTATAAAADQAGVEAIVLTHLHGNAVLLGELDTWRRGRGLALIEDCAQAHGLRVDGRHVGADADAATYSFYPMPSATAVWSGSPIPRWPDEQGRCVSTAGIGSGSGSICPADATPAWIRCRQQSCVLACRTSTRATARAAAKRGVGPRPWRDEPN